MALGLQPDDEVIVPAFTYVATAEVIALLRLKPIMVDVDPKTFNITPKIVEKALTPRTKAIVPVHLFGQSAEMEPLMSLGNKYGLHIIEDFAHHPTAVQQTIEAIQNRYKSRKIFSVFEPRSATSRRKVFQKDYLKAFSKAQETVGDSGL